MITPAMPGLIKVGAATIDPMERARQLSASTSAALPFVLAYSRFVAFPFAVEAALHRELDPYRVNDSREFFRLPLHEVIKLVDTYDEVKSGDALPWANLFATFPDDDSPRSLTEHERWQCEQLAARLKT